MTNRMFPMAVLAALLSCKDSTDPQPRPAPVLTSLTPATAVAEPALFTVSGAGPLTWYIARLNP